MKKFYKVLIELLLLHKLIKPMVADVLTLHLVQDMSLEEIGEIFDLGKERVRQLLKVGINIMENMGDFLELVEKKHSDLITINKFLLEEKNSLRSTVIKKITSENLALTQEIIALKKALEIRANTYQDDYLINLASTVDEDYFKKSIKDLNLNKNLTKVLRDEKIDTIGHLVDLGYEKLSKIFGIGDMYCSSIESELNKIGFSIY
jgi:predicted DNA-binding protein YlxM (UPF0122 family)